MKYKITVLSYITICLLLSACGFHLRGLLNLPPSFQHVYLQIPPNGRSLQIKLKEELQSYHVTYSESATHAAYQIVIDGLVYTRQISNISSSTTPRQFQLNYSVNYRLLDNQGVQLIPAQQIKSSRLVSMNSERLLGSNYVEDFFKNDMEQEIASQILTHINYYFNRPL